MCFVENVSLVGTSVDGFVAGPNCSFDFLHGEGHCEGHALIR